MWKIYDGNINNKQEIDYFILDELQKYIKNKQLSNLNKNKSRKKSCYQFDNNGIFIKNYESITDVKIMNFCDKNISKAIKKKTHKAHKYFWFISLNEAKEYFGYKNIIVQLPTLFQ